MKSSLRAKLVPAALFALSIAAAACGDSSTSPTAPASETVPEQKKQPAPGPAPSPTPAPAPSRPFYAGAYLGDAATKPELVQAAITDFAAKSGKAPSLVKSFHTLDCDWSATGWCGQLIRKVGATGATNYLAIDVRWTGAPAGGVLDAINAGQADAALTRMARQLAAYGQTVMLEPGWEMNGNWAYAWQGALNGNDAAAPARYAAAWRHMVDLFRREGATNVRWVFNPNVGNPLTHAATGSSHWNWYANYYPGNGYVDYVGAHGFNGPSVWGGSWQDFGTMTDGAAADHMLSDLAARYPGKPIIIGEFATQEGTATQKAQWIADAYAKMLANPAVIGAVWFNANKEADWRIDSSAASLAAFKSALAPAAVQTAFQPVAASATLLAGG
jgi:hypothetical protein